LGTCEINRSAAFNMAGSQASNFGHGTGEQLPPENRQAISAGAARMRTDFTVVVSGGFSGGFAQENNSR